MTLSFKTKRSWRRSKNCGTARQRMASPLTFSDWTRLWKTAAFLLWRRRYATQPRRHNHPLYNHNAFQVSWTSIFLENTRLETNCNWQVEFFVDIAASRYVFRVKKLVKLLRFSEFSKIKLKWPQKCFRLRDSTLASLSQAKVPFATPLGIWPVFVTLDMVQAKITALLNMDVLDRERVTPG